MTSDHESWILAGYKGKEQVDWITEKIGKVGEALKVAVFVSLNKSKLTCGFLVDLWFLSYYQLYSLCARYVIDTIFG
jgi:hypothetical protein